MQGTEERETASEGGGELKELTETPVFKRRKKEENWRKTQQAKDRKMTLHFICSLRDDTGKILWRLRNRNGENVVEIIPELELKAGGENAAGSACFGLH